MPLLDRGINTTDGEYWRYSRSLIKPTFQRSEICNFECLEFHFGRLLSLLPRDGSTLNLQPLLSRLVRLLRFFHEQSTWHGYTRPRACQILEAPVHYIALTFLLRKLQGGQIPTLILVPRHLHRGFGCFMFYSSRLNQ